MESAEIVLPPCLMPSVSNTLVESSGTVKEASPPSLQKICPWGKSSAAEAVSLNDVMSEQLAKELQHEEEGAVNVDRVTADSDCLKLEDTDTSDDFLLAQMLQLEFDKEHDKILQKEEKKLNGGSKVSVSFENYRRLPDTSYSDDEDEDDDVLEQNSRRHWDTIDQAKKTLQAVGKSGVSRQNNTTTTKHDLAMCGRRNTGRLMEFPPGIDTGDGGGFDMKISNNVYNTLKIHSIAEDRRSNKVHDKKEKATAEKALDEKTRLILYKLVNAEILEEINGCISTGKEACIYHASSKQSEESSFPTECALKIFKTTLNEFQNRDQYIKDDHRFRDRFGRQNPRKTIHMWAEKEMRNLMRIKKANIPCPEVLALKKHILVMSFIGKDTIPAPKLKDTKLSFADATLAYEQTIEIMKILYDECRLVHADLSEYNLLWYEDKVWVIDVSQAVEITHPCSLEFLIRDCKNICDFFEKRGVKKVLKPDELFTKVCGRLPDEY